MAISPLAGKPAPRDMLVYAHTPDLDNAAERVSFGTSGHRGSSLRGSFTEAHILAITQAICARGQGIDGATASTSPSSIPRSIRSSPS